MNNEMQKPDAKIYVFNSHWLSITGLRLVRGFCKQSTDCLRSPWRCMNLSNLPPNFVESAYLEHHVDRSYSWQISIGYFRQSATYLQNFSAFCLSINDPWVDETCLVTCECRYGERISYLCGRFEGRRSVNFWIGAWKRLDFILSRISHFRGRDEPYLSSEWTTVGKRRCVG